jgi:hypothetical protein
LPAPLSVWDLLIAEPEVSSFAGAVQAAGLAPLFQGLDPVNPAVTLFVPTNDALAALAEWPAIQSDPQWLERFVLAQVLPGFVDTPTLFSTASPPPEFFTLNGDLLLVDPFAQTVNGLPLLVFDVATPTGLVHVVGFPVVVPPQFLAEEAPATVPPELPAEPLPATVPPAPGG